MAEVTLPSTETPSAGVVSAGTAGLAGGSGRLLRFDRVERIVHWANATLFAIVGSTAAILYLPPLSAQVGRRELVVTIHVYAGLLLPLPLLLGILGPRYGWRLRADLRRLNRWIPEDRTWLRRHGWHQERIVGLKQGKFNAGQKLNAAFTGGAILLMLATGSVMHWFKPFPLEWRTGATFVHDWIAIALFFTISGHMLFAFADRDSLGSMLTGDISQSWAKRHAPRWLAEEIKARRDVTSSSRPSVVNPSRAATPSSAPAEPLPKPADPLSKTVEPVSTGAEPLPKPADPLSKTVEPVSTEAEPASPPTGPANLDQEAGPARSGPVPSPLNVVPEAVPTAVVAEAGESEPDP